MKSYYVIISVTDCDPNTVAHEIYHAVRSILSHRGIADEEAGAWLSGLISEKAHDFYFVKHNKDVFRQVLEGPGSV